MTELLVDSGSEKNNAREHNCVGGLEDQHLRAEKLDQENEDICRKRRDVQVDVAIKGLAGRYSISDMKEPAFVGRVPPPRDRERESQREDEPADDDVRFPAR